MGRFARLPKIQSLDEIKIYGKADTLSDPNAPQNQFRVQFLRSKSGAQITAGRLTEKEYSEFTLGHSGHRMYLVSPIQKGSMGGKEYHTLANESLVVVNGAINWHLEDLQGNKRSLQLKEGEMVFYLPPYVLHQYEATSDNTSLMLQRTTSTIDTYYPESDSGRYNKLRALTLKAKRSG